MKDIRLKSKFISIALLLGVIWLVYVINGLFQLGWNNYGIVPRTLLGLRGIVFAPFLHGNLYHIVSNTFPLAVLMGILIVFYERLVVKVPVLIVIIGGLLVWIFGRTSSHIGASGLIYGLAAFLVAFGFYKKKVIAIIISIVVIFLYGGLIFGVLPTRSWISWEGHLFGALSGVVLARLFKNTEV